MAKKVKKEVVVNPNDPLITTIRNWGNQSQSNTARWELNHDKWHRMRMRIKKVKNYPFVGCSNLRMPTLETKIRKVKAALVNVIWGIRPVVQVIPEPTGTFDNALKVEKFLDHLICDVCNLTVNEQNELNKIPKNKRYNVGNDVSAPTRGVLRTDEMKRKDSEVKRGKNHPNFGKKLSEETKQKLSEIRKGKPWSEARRKAGMPIIWSEARRKAQETRI